MPTPEFMIGELNILLWGHTGRSGTKCCRRTVWLTLDCVRHRAGKPRMNLAQAIAYLRRELFGEEVQHES